MKIENYPAYVLFRDRNTDAILHIAVKPYDMPENWYQEAQCWASDPCLRNNGKPRNEYVGPPGKGIMITPSIQLP